MFRTGLVIGLAVALIGFTAQPSIADDDDDRGRKKSEHHKKKKGGGGDKNITVNVTVDNTQIENTLNTIVQRLDAILAGQQNTTVNVTTENADYEFVGFTAATIDGNPGGGLPTAYQTCQDEFGPTARLCNMSEYFRSPALAFPATTAWIIPQPEDNFPRSRKKAGAGKPPRQSEV